MNFRIILLSKYTTPRITKRSIVMNSFKRRIANSGISVHSPTQITNWKYLLCIWYRLTIIFFFINSNLSSAHFQSFSTTGLLVFMLIIGRILKDHFSGHKNLLLVRTGTAKKRSRIILMDALKEFPVNFVTDGKSLNITYKILKKSNAIIKIAKENKFVLFYIQMVRINTSYLWINFFTQLNRINKQISP